MFGTTDAVGSTHTLHLMFPDASRTLCGIDRDKLEHCDSGYQCAVCAAEAKHRAEKLSDELWEGIAAKLYIGRIDLANGLCLRKFLSFGVLGEQWRVARINGEYFTPLSFNIWSEFDDALLEAALDAYQHSSHFLAIIKENRKD